MTSAERIALRERAYLSAGTGVVAQPTAAVASTAITIAFIASSSD
jgi:hypothetical protein